MPQLYDVPVHELMRRMANDLLTRGNDIISRRDAINWFSTNYPLVSVKTVNAHLVRLSVNDSSRKHHPVAKDGSDDVFYKIDNQHFRKYNSLSESLHSDSEPLASQGFCMGKKNKTNLPKWVTRKDSESASSPSSIGNEIAFSVIICWAQGQIFFNPQAMAFSYAKPGRGNGLLSLCIEANSRALVAGGDYLDFDESANPIIVKNASNAAKAIFHPERPKNYAITSADETRYLHTVNNGTFEQHDLPAKWGTYRLEK